MKTAILSALVGVSLVSSRFVEEHMRGQAVLNIPTTELEPLFLLEFTNGTSIWAPEAMKWQLKKDNVFFMDTTNYHSLGDHQRKIQSDYNYPKTLIHQEKVHPLLQTLNKTNLETNLAHLTTFHNRFYNSTHGEASFHWLLSTILTTIASTGAHNHGVTATPFPHPWAQHSIIVRIPGRHASTIVIGAHQDSINHADPAHGRAPGADDDGSGTVTTLEVLRTLLSDPHIRNGKAEHTIEFHWYAAEEMGLWGSQAVFSEYERLGKDVRAMLEVDMTGFWNETSEGKRQFGLMMDVATAPLMDFAKLIIEEYTDIPWIETGCSRCGSDHMSAIKAGYPGIYVFEGEFDYGMDRLHGPNDVIEVLDFEHMIDHAKMTLAFVYELAFAGL